MVFGLNNIRDFFKLCSCIWIKIKNPNISFFIDSKVYIKNVNICKNGGVILLV